MPERWASSSTPVEFLSRLRRACPFATEAGQSATSELDLFVDKRVVVEIKSVDVLHPIHLAQVISYLRVTGARVGLLINFNVPVLKQAFVA